MTDEAQAEVPNIEVVWREVPTLLAEVALGHAHAGGIIRIVMGEVVFNEIPGANLPRYRPVVNLAMPLSSLDHMITYLEGIRGQLNGDQ